MRCMRALPDCGSTTCKDHRSIPVLTHAKTTKATRRRPCRPALQARLPARRSVVVDDDLATVVIDVPVVIAPLADNRVAIAVIASLPNYFALANDIAVTMARTDRHADRTHAHPDFFCTCLQRGSDKCGSRYSSKT